MSGDYVNPMRAGSADLETSVTETERMEIERRRAEAEARVQYLASPVGQAEAAWKRGDMFFQFSAPLSTLKGRSTDIRPITKSTTETTRHSATDTLGQIEDMGWRLTHFATVFVETESNSRGKILSTGEVTRTSGYVEGSYVFRRSI